MTNKVVLRTTDEFMADYTPIYQPIFPLFMTKAQSYSEQTGTIDFNRVTAVSDIRAKHITPKDTEMRQIGVTDGKKTFKKYFLGNQFVQSALQDQSSTEDVVAQVLDEHQKQADSLLLMGDGTTTGDLVNNGLYLSTDPNYALKASVEVSGTDKLPGFYAQIMADVMIANQTPGRKMIMFYGAAVLGKVVGLFSAQPVTFRSVLETGLGAGWSVSEMPDSVTPDGAAGYIIVNLDQVKLHYTVLPQLKAQGVNEEKMYSWFNFLMGSMMLEVLAANAVLRRPITFAA